MNSTTLGSNGRSHTILNIDDNAANRYIKTRLLRAAGYLVVEGSTGTEALRLARQAKPQLALVDVKLPDISGLDVCRSLKSDNCTRPIMVLLVSALAVRCEDKVAGLEEGADGYLVEPADPDELLAMVRALLRLYRQEQTLSAQARLLNLSNDSILIRDEQDRIVYWNQGAESLYGWRREEAIGRISRELFQTEYSTPLEQIISTIQCTGRWSGELIHITRDGRQVFIESRWSQEREPGGKPGPILEINSDITERKRAEEALRVSEAQLRTIAQHQEQLVEERTRELVQSQIHLRALATELTLAEQHERQRLASELHDYLGQLLALTQIKLDLARRQPMHKSLAIILTDAHDVIDKSLSYTRTLVSQLYPPVLAKFGLPAALQWLVEQLRQDGLVVSLHVKTHMLPLPDDQARLLFGSVRELLRNCKKYSQVSQATVVLEQIKGSLQITVSDQGVGFNPEPVIDRVEKGNSQTSSFGLFSIRERMLSLGGRFDLKATPGKGTEAILILPLIKMVGEPASREAKTSMPEKEISTPNRLPGARLRILVVDDHTLVRQGICGLLAMYGDIEVVGEAANGEEAIEFSNRLQPDIILMDITMPRLDGIEATRRIKEQHPDIIVIGLSVLNSPQIEAAMKEAGAVALLNKETAVNELYETIKSASGTGQRHASIRCSLQ
jgi:PAS domain S-box-containing protein